MPLKIFKHKFLTAIIIILVIIGGYFVYQKLAGDKSTVQYGTAAVEKGTLIVSISGSGQVIVLDQVDIKPKVSGEITALYINKDQEVKLNQLLAVLDSRAAEKTIRDAQVALNNAKVKLEELISQPEAKSLLQAENAVAQAERDLNNAKENYEEIKIDAERSLATAYEDAASTVSTIFFNLSNYMKDLKDVLGTDLSPEEYISGYKIILGSESLFIQKLLDDYYSALDFFNKNFIFFREVYREDDRDTIYQLLGNTTETAKAISRAIESARHMFDAIAVLSYKHLRIASQIDKMQPIIKSDVSAVYSNISSLQRIKDTIDDTNKNTPKKIENAQLSIQSAQEKLDEKKLALEELRAGADSQDIESQRNTVDQKEDALLDAKEKLANCFIRAPFDGIIAEVNDKVKKGDSVSSGTTLATLITKQKIAEISLNEIDAAKVKVGQKATFTFDALPDISISGQVIEVDTVGTVTQGVVSYGVKLAFDIEEEQIKPGMSVAVDIITDVKQNVVLAPNSAVKYQNNAQYVEVMTDNNIIRPVTVQTGISNDTMTEIVSGLKEGDIIVTSTISSTKAQTTQTQKTQTPGFQIPGMGGQQMRMR